MEKVTVKLKYNKLNNDIYFIVTNYDDKILITRKLKEDDIYLIKISKGRSIKSLGKYWLIVNALAYFKDLSEDFVHYCLKKQYFGIKESVNPFTGFTEEDVQSIAFEKLDEIKFKEYLNFVVKEIESIGIDVNEMIYEYKHGVGSGN